MHYTLGIDYENGKLSVLTFLQISNFTHSINKQATENKTLTTKTQNNAYTECPSDPVAESRPHHSQGWAERPWVERQRRQRARAHPILAGALALPARPRSRRPRRTVALPLFTK